MKRTTKISCLIGMLLLLIGLPAFSRTANADEEECDHKFTDWYVETVATCVEEGVTARYCQICGEYQSYSTGFGSHWYGYWHDDQEATCTQEGKQSRTCYYCDNVETRTVAMLPHTFGPFKTVTAATDFDYGVRECVCSVCGHVHQEGFLPEGTLVYADRGEIVQKLQVALNEAGFDCGEPDGVFGEMTEAAILAFEQANGLKEDGFAWPGIQKMLLGIRYTGTIAQGGIQLTLEYDQNKTYKSGDTLPIRVKVKNIGTVELTDIGVYVLSVNAGNGSVNWQKDLITPKMSLYEKPWKEFEGRIEEEEGDTYHHVLESEDSAEFLYEYEVKENAGKNQNPILQFVAYAATPDGDGVNAGFLMADPLIPDAGGMKNLPAAAALLLRIDEETLYLPDVQAGDQIRVNLVAENLGESALNDLHFEAIPYADLEMGEKITFGILPADQNLESGKEFRGTYTYTVREEDLEADLLNLDFSVCASAADPALPDSVIPVWANCTFKIPLEEKETSLLITEVHPAPIYPIGVGDVIPVTITVKNAGRLDVGGLSLEVWPEELAAGDNHDFAWSAPEQALEKGKEFEFIYNFTVQEADLLADDITRYFSVHGNTMATQFEGESAVRSNRIFVQLRDEDAVMPLMPELKLSVAKVVDGKTSYKPGDEIAINWKLTNTGTTDVTFTGLYLYYPEDGKAESIEYHMPASQKLAEYNLKLRAGSANEASGTVKLKVPEEKASASSIVLYLSAEGEENGSSWISEYQKITLPRAK
ncbi:MAG: peptidoglycan-binding protein [Lachnospiraceae bacterium]|nr:peptidoglycan-binding protein [Lachnospiraceae bacterium]